MRSSRAASAWPRLRATGFRSPPSTPAPREPTPTTGWRASLSTAASPSPRRGLGRGLEVLLGGVPAAAELAQLPVGSIRPNTRQPRKRLDSEGIEELVESVRAQGLVQPV